MIKSLSDNYWQNCLHEGSNQLFQCDTGKKAVKKYVLYKCWRSMNSKMCVGKQ